MTVRKSIRYKFDARVYVCCAHILFRQLIEIERTYIELSLYIERDRDGCAWKNNDGAQNMYNICETRNNLCADTSTAEEKIVSHDGQTTKMTMAAAV